MHSRRSDLLVISLLASSTALVYGARLSVQPLVGEETRWATAARDMLATGDFLVPRQQGQVFPERPPMTIWLIAAAGWLRGDVDPVAIRLPSVIAVVLTSVLIYVYARSLISQAVGVIGALAYATFGQVLQIGRLGESEAVFALFVGSSLLVWHLGYMRGWRPLAVWSVAFTFAALASLVKGPQAPVYFGAILGTYLLLVRRDWRYLASWHFVCGFAIYVTIVAAWQVPFYHATDWEAVVATWAGLAGDRFNLRGMIMHAVTYPIETFVCLLPWSPILIALLHPQTRQRLDNHRQVVLFLATAIAVAYPTVWLAAGARGRYFMPMYPLVAVLVGVVIERCSTAAVGTYPRRAWHQFLLLWGIVAMSGATVMGVAGLKSSVATRLHQPQAFSLAFAVLCGTVVLAVRSVYRRPAKMSPIRAVLAINTLAAVGAAGIMVNVNVSRWNDPSPTIAEFRRLLPAGANLVSLTPIEHRFAYYFGEPITELNWPHKVADLPPNVEYFCFMRMPGDTADSRAAGRGRTWYKTPGRLPFAWEELKAASVDRRIDSKAMVVVLGRVLQPLQAKVTDATVPQRAATTRSPSTLQR
jgi:4-amino-4-deoxy-L-arabinose transferase-like glycosyltransferase